MAVNSSHSPISQPSLLSALCSLQASLHWSMIYSSLASLHFNALSTFPYHKLLCSPQSSLHSSPLILTFFTSLDVALYHIFTTLCSALCSFFTSLYFSLLTFLPSPCSTLCSLHSCEAVCRTQPHTGPHTQVLTHRSSLPGGLPPTDTAPPLYCSLLCCTLHTGSGQLCLYTVQLCLYTVQLCGCTAVLCILQGARGREAL